MREATNITTRAMKLLTTWFFMSANWSPNLPPAKNELDESTRLTPIAIRESVMTRMRRSTFMWSRRWPGVSSTVPGSDASVFCTALPSLKTVDTGAEHFAALLVVLEHVEAGARGREQNGVAGVRALASDAHRVRHVARIRKLDVTGQRTADDGARLADQDGAAHVAQVRQERGEVAFLVAPAQDQDRMTFDADEALHGGVDVGGL